MKSGVSNFGIAMSYPMVERLRTSYQWLPEIKKINKIRYLPKSICGMERMTLLRAHEVPETEERDSNIRYRNVRHKQLSRCKCNRYSERHKRSKRRLQVGVRSENGNTRPATQASENNRGVISSRDSV